jgi:threonine dehydratase
VEPTGSPTVLTALDRGGPVDIATGGLAADSLGCKRAGADAYRIVVDRVDRVVLVTDEQTVDAQRWLWENCRVIAEPGGATALAAVLSGIYEIRSGERLAVIVCGANTDPATVTAAR